MKIQFINKPFSYFIIDDFYDEIELKSVVEEVSVLKPYALTAEKTKTATNETGKYLKSGKGIFLDTLFSQDRSVSKVLNNGRKLFATNLANELVKHDPSFGHLGSSTNDTTLVNYYESGEEYKAHKDTSTLSAVLFLKAGDFEGGNFCFPDFNEEVEFKHNRLVIFHSCMRHYAKAIFSNDSNSYRASIAHFIGYGAN